jgi:hypothetical protein
MQIYNIPAHRRGDTWDGINNITLAINNEPIDLTDAVITMELREEVDSPVVLTFSTVNDTILITDAVNGAFSIPEIIVDIPFGKYIYDIQVVLASGKTKTYIGGTWEIASDVTE